MTYDHIVYRKIVLGTKLVRRQIRQESCLHGAGDLIGKHRHTQDYGTRLNVVHAKANSVNRML